MNSRDVSPQHYASFCTFLERETGIVLGPSKQYLVRSRLVGLLHEYPELSIDSLVDKAVAGRDRKLQQQVVDAMTTNETLWFRDNYPFTLLSNEIIPALAKLNRKLRIWSAACSTGQEAYSIAMTLFELQEKQPQSLKFGFEIIGTDISERVLQQATDGHYDAMAVVRGLSEPLQRKYFERRPDGTLVANSALKRVTQFRKLNLISSYSALGKFDVVFCRNVLIYFSADNKKLILQQIAASLNAEGSLLLGASESVAAVADLFQMVKAANGLYYKKKS